MKKFVFLLVLFSASFQITSCSEADFYLSPDSRLPRWFDIPEGEKRENYTVKLSYYVSPGGRKATLKLKEEGGWLTKKKIIVKLKGLEPIKLKNSSDEYYPSYEILIGDEITDIVEHRERNNIFYMTDNPVVREELGIKQ